MNVAWEFVSPIGTTVYYKSPHLVLKAVMGIESSATVVLFDDIHFEGQFS